MDLDAYRHSAETFVSDLEAVYYRHYAGLDDEFEIEPIYQRHPELFTRAAVETLRGLAQSAPAGTDQCRSRWMLLDFAVQGHIGQATKALEAELARREAELCLEVAGESLGYRESSVVQANEPVRARRAEIERARLTATDEALNPLHVELIEIQHATARELGYTSYREMCAECKRVDLGGLHAQTAGFSADTEASYGPVLDPELRRALEIGVEELRCSDLPRFFRASGEDDLFPARRLVPSFIETMRGLGIDVPGQAGVLLDLEPRPRKSPRAFCAAVRAPGEIHLVISPVGGRDDFAALFHESGHTEHYAHVDPELPFEFRYLGDNAVTEAFAFLFEHLVENPRWLIRRLGVGDPSSTVSHARAQRLVYLRRYAAKLAYELELHGASAALGPLADRYSQLLGAALKLDWPAETFLADVDAGFYCASYLRAWALETHLRRFLQDNFGEAWFEVPAAGDTLRGLWSQGQRLGAEELLGELTGEQLDFGVLVGDLGLAP